MSTNKISLLTRDSSAFEENPTDSNSVRCNICAQFYPDTALGWTLRKSVTQHLRSEKHKAACKLAEEQRLTIERRKLESLKEAETRTSLNPTSHTADLLPSAPTTSQKPSIYEWTDLFADALGNEHMFSAGADAPEVFAAQQYASQIEAAEALIDTDFDSEPDRAEDEFDEDELLSNVTRNLRDMGNSFHSLLISSLPLTISPIGATALSDTVLDSSRNESRAVRDATWAPYDNKTVMYRFISNTYCIADTNNTARCLF